MHKKKCDKQLSLNGITGTMPLDYIAPYNKHNVKMKRHTSLQKFVLSAVLATFHLVLVIGLVAPIECAAVRKLLQALPVLTI